MLNFSNTNTKLRSSLVKFAKRLDVHMWDLDGTLIINNEQSALSQIGQVIKDHIFKTTGYTDDYHYQVYAGMPLPKIRKAVEMRLQKLNLSLPNSLDDDIRAIRKETPLKGEPVIVHPFVQMLLDVFREAGVHQCIATSSELDRAVRYVNAANLNKYFSTNAPYIFAGHKPDPTCILAARASAGVQPENAARALGLEDSASGVAGHVCAGNPTIGHVLAHHILSENKADHAEILKEKGAVAVITNEEEAGEVYLDVLKNVIPERRMQFFTAPRYMPQRRESTECFTDTMATAAPMP